ncbi:nucleic acid-binding, OB-fold-like protein [Actinidia rufa]|uniref:Nucleic acid-binding, OB-fold-like protein n=1 Tax=Actinidia rufa TaxID=165716 RepID=A0A7J0GW94_9ERIC|nr:nucleic acid-binding, OB-fold-like protein [Actinidia rufa]
MKGGRKNLKRAAGEETFIVQQGQSVMRVVSLRGSNLIEVMDARGENALALFPAKFQKSMWIKREIFKSSILDNSWKELEGDASMPDENEISSSNNDGDEHKSSDANGDELNSSDDDGLPPIEANMNRRKHLELHSDPESDSEADS